jgi:hypothetical protein
MKKQTAVEWLMDRLPTIDKNDPYYEDIIQQAKAMEKEQMESAYIAGRSLGRFADPENYFKHYYGQ